ncbi:allantoinase AllB [Shouchella patagoniensis]|uniref:allantoinase AllB n=1 Tax=Shouchella patagoniensis TaxID=228576 RepID=UPI000994C141|nr:allantoinase AllB [Shouchella patagoniensis]
MLDLLITGGRVVLNNRVEFTNIGIRNGKIIRIGSIEQKEARQTIDANGQLVFPGAVDTHVHISEPGRTEWEGFETGSKSLAAGGTTTYLEMPLNALPATTNSKNLQLKLEAAKKQNYIDYGFYGGLTPDNLDELAALADSDVVAFKCFLSTCGSDEPGDFKNVDEHTLLEGMRLLAKKDQLLCIHAEDADLTDTLEAEMVAREQTSADDYVASRPILAEVIAVKQALEAAKETGCALHFVHISSAEAIQVIQAAKMEGVDVTVESCPHYFTLSAEELDVLGTLAKCQPPLRSKAEVEKLWGCLLRGEIDWLASDHSPCTPDLKQGNFFSAWGGISGCQNTVDLMFDEAVKKRKMPIVDFAQLIATKPAKRMHLSQKGEIAVGKDADLFFLDENQTYTVSEDQLFYKNKHTPYTGREIGCKITRVLVRGTIVYDALDGFAKKRIGQFVRPNKTQQG